MRKAVYRIQKHLKLVFIVLYFIHDHLNINYKIQYLVRLYTCERHIMLECYTIIVCKQYLHELTTLNGVDKRQTEPHPAAIA